MADQNLIPFTPAVYAEMQDKYQKLQQERKEVIERLQTAREMGDLSENGAYKYAKFELGNVGRQLRQLKYLLDNGQPVSSHSTTVVSFGSTVTLTNPKRSMTFMVVSEHESDPTKQKLSTKSPVGQAVFQKKLGDVVSVTTPNGEIEYTIEKIA